MPSQKLTKPQSWPVSETMPSGRGAFEHVPSTLLWQQSGTGWRGSMSQVPAWLHTPPGTLVAKSCSQNRSMLMTVAQPEASAQPGVLPP
jgi:hypothetical protein